PARVLHGRRPRRRRLPPADLCADDRRLRLGADGPLKGGYSGTTGVVAASASVILPDGTERELQGEVTLGRAPGCDLALEAATVSRLHAVIGTAGSNWYLEDRGSFNGTTLNGTRIQPGVKLPLRHGDRIGLGTEHLVFSYP